MIHQRGLVARYNRKGKFGGRFPVKSAGGWTLVAASEKYDRNGKTQKLKGGKKYRVGRGGMKIQEPVCWVQLTTFSPHCLVVTGPAITQV